MVDDEAPDLVGEVFERMRSTAKTGGKHPPSLQRPPRKNSGFTLDAGPRVVKRDEEGRIAGDGGDTAPVVRDRAGTRVPQRLLYRDGIRIRRRRDRSPLTFGAVLAGQANERGWQRNIANGIIMSKWPDIVGEVIADHAEVVEFKENTLVVQCASSTWATQLRLAQSKILATIAEEVGDGIVEKLHIKGPSGPSWSKGRLRVKGRGPRDTYG
ncbi:DUF721 domain-containing protein [Corynebacterium hansenii]|uniref:DUF721 domain-containing protein n=1 Tax=Corynebacterium hansenii TaxID=394964 RepID=A0ABV7ZNZ4_9CORY|nr:DciA family protein [Corynebacterium hansenii]WJY98652.1 hypothetical protein CHAN_00020 [Corynebacterium hansenii]